MWRDKFAEWGQHKNIPARKIGYMVGMREKRARDEGKDTIFIYGETHVSNEKLNSYKKRKVTEEDAGRLCCKQWS
jgi:hypothetical protein